MEGHRGGFRVEEVVSPVGTIPVGGEGHGRGARVFAHHEGRVRGKRKSVPGGQRRGGGSRPALECTFPLSFPSGGLARRLLLSFFLLFFLTVGGVGGPL